MIRHCILLLVFLGISYAQGVCNDSLTTSLPDSAFTASTDYTTKDSKHIYHPFRGRLNTKVDPNPKAYKVGSWVALDLNQNQWIQVDLGSPGVVQSVTTEGRNPDPQNKCCDQWVTRYSLEYSLDGVTWTPVTNQSGGIEIFEGNTDTDTPVTNELGCPIIAQYVRVKPQEWHKHIALRFDVNGCMVAAPTTAGPSTVPTTTQTTVAVGVLSHGECVKDCSSKPDGYYQSCHGCEVYVKCYQHKITDDNPCPRGQVWNDNLKFCDMTSTSCHGSTTQGTTTTECVSNCSDKADGFYQSCMGCEFYAKCYGKVLTDGNPCPAGTVWNDNLKFCDTTSTSCHSSPSPPPTTQPTTASTTTTTIPPTTPTTLPTTTTTPTTTTMPPTTTSTTTTMPPTTTTSTTTTTPTTTTPTTTTTTTVKQATAKPTPAPTKAPTAVPGNQGGKPRMCVSDCAGLPSGDYQSCKGCHYFVSCSNGYTYDNKNCPGALVWDNDGKICAHSSPTCP